MNHYTHLTIDEREKIMVLLNLGKNISQIAHKLNRHHSTISREISRNRPPKKYSAENAQKRYAKMKRNCGAKHLLLNIKLREFVEQKLKKRWRAEEISNYIKKENLPYKVSASTIYRAYDCRIINQTFKKYFPQKRKNKRRKNTTNQGIMQNTVSIKQRSKWVDKKLTIGHYEGDTVLGQRKTGSILTMVERFSMYLMARKLETREKKEVEKEMIAMFENIPKSKVKTITLDNGKEFQNHINIAEKTNTKIYFCEPYSPWQRGLNENLNRTLREYFPKKTSYAKITNEDIFKTVEEINNRPRKRLNYYTPNEVFHNPKLLKKLCT